MGAVDALDCGEGGGGGGGDDGDRALLTVTLKRRL